MSLAYCRGAANRVARSLQRSVIYSSSLRNASRQKSNHHIVTPSSRAFSASVSYADEPMEQNYEQRRLPLTQFTEDEEMVRDAARHWANEELRPLVRDMDNEGKTRPEIIQGLFDHGFMGMVSKFHVYCNICVLKIR